MVARHLPAIGWIYRIYLHYIQNHYIILYTCLNVFTRLCNKLGMDTNTNLSYIYDIILQLHIVWRCSLPNDNRTEQWQSGSEISQSNPSCNCSIEGRIIPYLGPHITDNIPASRSYFFTEIGPTTSKYITDTNCKPDIYTLSLFSWLSHFIGGHIKKHIQHKIPNILSGLRQVKSIHG